MQTRTESLASLLQDGIFDVPSYQRSYSWEDQQLQELVDDLRYLPEDTSHFFGNIIIDKRDAPYETDRGRRFDMYEVVDGQQRLTTALIALHVATQMDEVVADTVAADNLIFPVDERPRLMPQDQDKEFFRDSLFGAGRLACETPSQERLENAKHRFESIFEELDVRSLAERLRYDCMVNVVEIDSDSEAASIFESLNDRGKPLSTLDKTKSFLMYMDDRSSNRGALEATINSRFGGIYQELFVLSSGHDRVGDFDEDSLQRLHWGIYDGYDSDEYFNSLDTLKQRLRGHFRDGEYDAVQSEIDAYTLNLREAASAFAALFKPSQRPDAVGLALNRLFALGKVATVLAVLMAAQMRYGDDEPDKMAAIVQACETLVFRVYAIDGRRTDTGRGKLVRLANSIRIDRSCRYEDVLDRLDSITRNYTGDGRFERFLRDPDFYESNSSQDIRYLFYHYGEHMDIEIGEDPKHDLEQLLSRSFEVEHILARHLPTEDVPAAFREEFDEHVNRLANLTVASGYWNKNFGNLPFTEKKTASSGRQAEYRSSALRVQQGLAAYDTFGAPEMDSREQEIVAFAMEHWGLRSEPQDMNGSSSEDEVVYEQLPASFFRRLTERQEAVVRILLEDGGTLLNTEIRQRMEDEYGLATGGGQALGRVLAGLTTKYGKHFTKRLILDEWTGEQVQYQLNPESGYVGELRERFVDEKDNI
jgi:hypothetical protein